MEVYRVRPDGSIKLIGFCFDLSEDAVNGAVRVREVKPLPLRAFSGDALPVAVEPERTFVFHLGRSMIGLDRIAEGVMIRDGDPDPAKLPGWRRV